MEYTAFLFAIIGLLQMFFIPGAILIKSINYKTNPLKFTTIAAGLSLTINYVLVYALVSAGIYTTITPYVIIGIEAVLMGVLYRNVLLKKVNTLPLSNR